MKKYKIAIIGGGFSGLCLAAMLGEKFGSSAIIIEGGKRVGKKLCNTGNGQGNITNKNIDISRYHGDLQFAKAVLERYTNTHLIAFFTEIGILISNIGDKIYPASFTANSVCDLLRFKIEDCNVETVTQKQVEKIERTAEGFYIYSNGEKWLSESVICAFGGSSGAGFNTDGTSYKLALNLGHKLTDVSPSLVQLLTEREPIKGLKGIKINANVSLYGNGTFIKSCTGDIIFTDYGVSGNAVFDLSAYLKGVANPSLCIEFLPRFRAEELKSTLIAKCNKGITAQRLLLSVVPTRIGECLLKACNISGDKIATKKDVESIVNALKALRLKVLRPASFEFSQVTAGGIDTSDVCCETMESKIVKGMYIIGEALNVDGDCGGFNLQWAFSSAAVCAEALCGKRVC